MRTWVVVVGVLLAGACSSPGALVSMDFRRPLLFDAPWPSDDLLLDDGHVDVSKLPNPDDIDLMRQAYALLAADARGFAATGAAYFRVEKAVDPASLPDLAGSLRDDASVQLVCVDRGSPDFGRRMPARVGWLDDGGPFAGPRLLAVLPLQGVPLRPGTRYAAVVLRAVRDVDGRALGQAPAVAELAGGGAPAGMGPAVAAEYRDALVALGERGVPRDDVAALAVFTTDRPTETLARARDAVVAGTVPAPTPFTRREVFDGYCVYDARITLPVFQAGRPPYTQAGGRWVLDENSRPVVQRMEESRLVVTVPRATTPAGGWPTVVFVRTGGGGDRPLVDRGVRGTDGKVLVPGTGPAQELARAGWAGVQIDGPLGGIRNPDGADEQFSVFNVQNADALRDNLRQQAVELALLAHVVPTLRLDASDCAGASASVTLDGTRLAIMGHSMGAWIAPMVLAVEPAYRAAILSGAGGSWIENVMYKQKPIEVRPIAEVLLSYTTEHRSLVDLDPALTFVQWAAEPSDPQLYGRAVIDEPRSGAAPRHVLMIQGIVDHYILPNIANATSLAMGLDLAGPALDETVAEIATQLHLRDALPLVGRRALPLPASGNREDAGTTVTAVVVQHPADAIEDGHEAMYQTEPPKAQVRCFLQTLAAGGGAPVVPADGGACP
jgi:hypothetical protein